MANIVIDEKLKCIEGQLKWHILLSFFFGFGGVTGIIFMVSCIFLLHFLDHMQGLRNFFVLNLKILFVHILKFRFNSKT